MPNTEGDNTTPLDKFSDEVLRERERKKNNCRKRDRER